MKRKSPCFMCRFRYERTRVQCIEAGCTLPAEYADSIYDSCYLRNYDYTENTSAYNIPGVDSTARLYQEIDTIPY